MNSKLLLENFLNVNNINSQNINLIEKEIQMLKQMPSTNNTTSNPNNNLDLIYKILTDTYNLNSKNVKECSSIFAANGFILGRTQKDLLKHYFDYKDEASLSELFQSISPENDINVRDFILDITKEYSTDYSQKAKKLFITNWQNAETNNDNNKKSDYLLGIYTKLYNNLELNNLSLKDLYNYNSPYIEKELNTKSRDILKNFCFDSTIRSSLTDISKIFYKKYFEILKEDLLEKSQTHKLEEIMNQYFIDSKINDFTYIVDTGNIINSFPTEKYSLVSLNINQNLFNKFNDKIKFYNYILSTISQIYRVLENYKVFSIHIENIFVGNRNIKWELYSYLGIFSEHFIPTYEKRNFYKPEVICNDMLELIGLSGSDENTKLLKLYYSGKIQIDELINKINYTGNLNDFKEFVDNFKTVWYGFTFTDCLCIRNNREPQDSEIDFIQNDNTLLLIFYKYRIDDRKIPCPVCGGLNISGNSFPEVGHKSWECKNTICPERSKSNRGKRYSHKSTYMQWGVLDNSPDNIISKDIIKQWRRDIIKIDNYDNIINMLVKYFSFPNENILLINYNSIFYNTINSLNRIPTFLNYDIHDYENISSNLIYVPKTINYNTENMFNNYFKNSKYVKRYLIKKPIFNETKNTLNNIFSSTKSATLIEGDCFEILSNIEENSITAEVTSPPYYNAREYSQWPNLYLYLKDMYNIICASYRVLKPGGIFLYNIGDISGNENTVVKSTMGNKRILLGAYTIQLFLEAGFELIDNILWDKGEPQSNRQKNDGKFTPHYQKPLNAYEHMFIFKKPGAPLILNSNIKEALPIGWNCNVVSFSPVIKINNKGKNLFGHTAPFPKDIPNFVAKVFTNQQQDILLDPFSGSFTSGIVAYENNIKGVGIELSHDYIDLSVQRAQSEKIPIDVKNRKSKN